MKKTISLLLVMLMIFSSIPVNVFAESSDFTTKENVSYNASNALGSLLTSAMDESEESTEENNGYGIFGIVFNFDTVDISVSAPDYATAIVSIYDEDTNKMVTSGREYVNSDTGTVTVTLADYELPDYFIIKVFLVDPQNAPLCNPYINKEYTKAFEEFFEKNIYDFDKEQVINLDESDETNFAVVSDNTTIITGDENANIVKTDDFENGIYVFENADENIKSLKKGDTLYYVYGEGENDYILAKVAAIETKGNLTTVAADGDCEIKDLFSYVDINTSNQNAPSTYAFDDEAGNENTNGEKVIPLLGHVNGINIEDDNCSIKADFSGNMYIQLSFYYDFNIGPDDYEFSYTFGIDVISKVELHAEGSYNTDLDKSFTIINTSVPIFTGLDITVKLELFFSFDAKLDATGSIRFSMKNGAKATRYSKEKINQEPTIEPKLKVTGSYEIHIMPVLATGFKVLKVIHAELSFGADFSTKGTLYVPFSDEERAQHSCAACVEGSIDFVFVFNIVVKFGKDKKDAKEIINFTVESNPLHIADYYANIKENGVDFGWGVCPNKVVRSGRCGTFLTATLLTDGTLKISGQGAMYREYEHDNLLDLLFGNKTDFTLPWWQFNSYDEQIKKVIVEEGVTTICDGAFLGCDVMETAYLPSTLTVIGGTSFGGDSLHTIYYNGTKAQWSNIKKGLFNGLNSSTIVCTDTYSLRSLSLEDESTNRDIAIIDTEETTEGTIISAIVGNSYMIIIVKTTETDDLFASDNLLFIDQKIAESETLSFDFELDESVSAYEIIYTNAFLHTHNYLSVVTTAATHIAEGVRTYICSCGDSYTESLSKIPVHTYSSEITRQPSHTVEGLKAFTCECGDSYTESIAKTPEHNHNAVVTAPTCTSQGYTTYTCACGDTYTAITTPATGHTDSDANGNCDSCGYDTTVNCSCNCHKSGFMGFIWKIINFFNKLFKNNKICACGTAHY